VQECLQTLGIVETLGRVRERGSFENASPRFKLPHDLEILAQAIILDRTERYEMLGIRHSGPGVWISRQLALPNLGDHIPPLPDVDQVTR
jgi:hypothetical protein